MTATSNGPFEVIGTGRAPFTATGSALGPFIGTGTAAGPVVVTTSSTKLVGPMTLTATAQVSAEIQRIV